MPEAYDKVLKAGITIDKVKKEALEDRVTQIIRENPSGPAGMDVSNLARKGEQAAASEAAAEHTAAAVTATVAYAAAVVTAAAAAARARATPTRADATLTRAGATAIEPCRAGTGDAYPRYGSRQRGTGTHTWPDRA